MPENTQAAVVKYVVDGDTVELADGRKVRYIGINTPERGQPFYAEATEMNRQFVENKPVQLEFDLETFDRYGRTLAYVWSNGVQVNYQMIRQGYANAFTVQPNVRYDQLFRQMEREAREAGRGLWAGMGGSLKIMRIQADAPGKDNENPNGEWIEIANQGQEPVLMQGYTLKDQANHIYTFGNFTVPPGALFRLFSGQGQNTPTQLYWGYVNDSVWNNDHDSAFLRDAQGSLADVYVY
jgi:micrococcal nuclease